MESFKAALNETADKMYTAVLTWGAGLLLMIVYCYIVYYMFQLFGEFVMILSGLIFLCAAFFFIDAWWTYKKDSGETE